MLRTIVATFQTVMGSSLSQQSAVDTVSQWRSRPPRDLIFYAGRIEISRYFQAVDILQQSPSSRATDELLATAMSRLKGEFDTVLRRHTDYHAGQASTTEWSSVADSTANVFRYEDYTLPEAPTDYEIAYLRNIAARMSSSGRIGECVRVYMSARGSYLEAQLKKLKFKELTTAANRNRYEWDELKVKMELWIQLSKICIKKLFHREKHICDQIFDGIGEDNSAKDDCFVGTVNEFARDLFGFVETMSMSKHSYDKMETILTLYSTFLSIFPDTNALFHSTPGNGIRVSCAETLSRIKSEVVGMLYEFEYEVLHEKSDVRGEGGGVDRLTEYAVEQMNFVVRNRTLLTALFNAAPSLDFGDTIIPQGSLGDVSNLTFIQQHLILILVVLQRNLKAKSETFKDPLSGPLFLMNNVHYIVRRIEASQELQEMVGAAYMNKLRGNLKSATDTYQQMISSNFLKCFEEDELYTSRCCFRPLLSKTVFRKKLMAFNSAYEKPESLGTIPDPQLRESICKSMCSELVPEYKKFVGRFSSDPEMALILKEEVRYSAEDFTTLILRKMFADAEAEAVE
ncbi:exocyst complex component EXO70A1-like [Andrographis paniculata]|uniref:exocyst complex component EXO70A1-like n=1 Tax=Andrographis paniculata TaxID=175694 RepID=UPI0021E9A97D|nr:exocyst complex component EXO70A1-like [Andrographis paniculata]